MENQVTDKDFKLPLKDILIFALVIMLAASASIFLKLGAGKFLFTLNPFDFLFNNYLLVLGYVLYILPFLLTLYLYKRYKLGFVQAVIAGVYIVTAILAAIFLQEKFNILKILGILIIFGAIIALTLSPKNNETN